MAVIRVCIKRQELEVLRIESTPLEIDCAGRVLTISSLIEAALLIVILVVAPLVLVVARLLLGSVLVVSIVLAPLLVVVILISRLVVPTGSRSTILREVLSRLEGLCAWLKCICSGPRTESPSLLRSIVVEVHLLGLSREIVVLCGWVIFPRVEV